MAEQQEAIHSFFGLTYSNYLVLPRSVLQSMPDEWQYKFVNLIEQIPKTIDEDFEPAGGYRVFALDEYKRFAKDLYSNYMRGRRKLKTKNGEGNSGGVKRQESFTSC